MSLESTSTSVKRKFSDYEKRRGAFVENCWPENVYPLGDNLFATITFYAKKTSIHLRYYRKYDDAYYPSLQGITMEVEQFHVLTSRQEPPVSIFDVVEMNMKLESLKPDKPKDLYILMTDNENFTVHHDFVARSGRIYPSSITFTTSQWINLLKNRDRVDTSYITLKYRNVNFGERFKLQFERFIQTESDNPYNDETLAKCLESVLYKQISAKKGLIPIGGADEFDSDEENSVTDFNESCMDLNIYGVCHDFMSELKNKKLLDCLTENFVNSVNFEQLIEKARKDYCFVSYPDNM